MRKGKIIIIVFGKEMKVQNPKINCLKIALPDTFKHPFRDGIKKVGHTYKQGYMQHKL